LEKIYRNYNYALLVVLTVLGTWLNPSLAQNCSVVNINFPDPTPDELHVCLEQSSINLVEFIAPNQLGGIFTGIGVTGTGFNPVSVGIGIYEVTYTLGTDFCKKNIVVSAVNIDFPIGVEYACGNALPLDLREHAMPAGGTFSGNGIIDGTHFDPSMVDQGSHIITYTLGTDFCSSDIYVSAINLPAEIDTMPTTFCLNSPPYLLSGNGTPQFGGFYLDEFTVQSILNENIYQAGARGVGQDTIIYVYTGGENEGCPVFDTTIVDVIELNGPDVMFEDTDKLFCKSGDPTVLLTANPEGGTFYSNDGAIVTDNKLDIANTPEGSYILYYEFGEIESGNCLDSLVISILNFDDIDLDFVIKPSICENQPDEIVYTGTPLPASTALSWSIDGAEIVEERGDSVILVNWVFPGDYKVTLELDAACSSIPSVTKEQPERENETCFSSIFIPNIFTPNDDNKNDEFYVMGKNIEVNQLVIYDRWGEKVFESNDGSAWDGTFRDQPLNSAVFYYYAEITTVDGTEVQKGNVTLIR